MCGLECKTECVSTHVRMCNKYKEDRRKEERRKEGEKEKKMCRDARCISDCESVPMKVVELKAIKSIGRECKRECAWGNLIVLVKYVELKYVKLS